MKLEIHQDSLIRPVVSFDPIDRLQLNLCLKWWGHKMGELERPFAHADRCYALAHENEIVAVIAHSSLISEKVAGLTREEAVEVSRVCASRPGLCRVVLRLWREFVFPHLNQPWALSYQDAVQHKGNLYRFDGWVRLGRSRSGTDPRKTVDGEKRRGRRKIIWGWADSAALRNERKQSDA